MADPTRHVPANELPPRDEENRMNLVTAVANELPENTGAPPEPITTEPIQITSSNQEPTIEAPSDPHFYNEKEVDVYEKEEVEPEGYGLSDSNSSNSVEKAKLQPEPKPSQASLRRNQSNVSGITTQSSGTMSRYESQTQPQPHYPWYRWLSLRSRTPPAIPKERKISPEYKASVFSQMSFQWINPLMHVGYQRPLELNDIFLVNPDRTSDVMATRLKTAFENRLAKGDKKPLLKAMYDTFKFEFVLGGACQLMVAIIQSCNPFVLRYLIQFAGEAYYAEELHRPAPNIGHGIGLVFAVTILQTIQNICTNQFMYRGMIVGAQARGTLIALIFDKSMTISGRARAGGKAMDDEIPDEKLPADLKPESPEEKSWLKKHLGRNKKPKKEKSNQEQKIPGVLGDGQGYGNGRIVNLMSVDTYRIDQASGMFHMIWTSPIAIVLTLILLLVNITYSALAGFAIFIAVMPLLAKAIGSLVRRRKGINKITDERVSLTQEILQGVRFVKYFGWELSFLKRLRELRTSEIRSIQFLLSIRNGINAIGMSLPVFASMFAFICYAYTHPGLNPALIFSSLALFNSLRLPLNMLPLVLGQVTDAVSSIYRIQQFLLAEDAHDDAEWNTSMGNAIEVQDGSFTWERSPTKPDEKTDQQKRVEAKMAKKEEKRASKISQKRKSKQSVDLDNEKHQEIAIPDSPTSPTFEPQRKIFTINDLDFSIGREELVAVIGGVGSGKSSLLAALAGDMRRTNGKVVFGASRAFCPQYAWIQNATVKDNVLFGKDMNESWYKRVIDACALRADLDMLPHGDLTEIGERGITVSGGQKQRLNIARAIYFNSDVVLMDDPLSAVDAHVGRHIMDNAICGLLKHKCRVLATHQLWVLKRCDRIIWMDHGRIQAIDTFDKLMSTNEEFVKLIANNAQEERQSEEDEVDDGDEKAKSKKKKSKKPQTALMTTEERAVKSVSTKIYFDYFRASGSILVLPLIILLLILSQGAVILTSLWLSWWTSNKFNFPLRVYVGVYAALGFCAAFFFFIFAVSITFFGTQASKVLLHRAVNQVLRAPMSFFDTTPLGRISNRFSKDVDTMDNMLTDSIRFFCLTMGMIISVFILIIAYYYFFAVALGPLFIVFVWAAAFYRASAREVKRHESVLRSEVFSRFSESVSGVATIRAYGLQDRFRRTIRTAVDQMDSAYYLTFANQRWLSVRLDLIGNALVFVVGILVVTSRFSVDPSTGGLVLSYILTIVQMIQFTVRQLAEVENNMNSTERIHYYGHNLEEEAPAHLPNPDVTESWPQKGEIIFDNVQMRYREGLPLVLKGLDLHVKGGERIGVVGRTGAGKSSIMSTLFRLVELSGGHITIDGVDIAKVGLSDLRSRLSIIPQDPTLFRGTVRSNLDPFGKYTDHQLWSALRSADLVGESESGNDGRPSASPESEEGSSAIRLDSHVEEEGLNFSLGQRQLMALARALVRGSQIIVCDEATSSVDMNTDEKVQRTLNSGFKGKTLLCIAHRLKTIIHYDRILVMDNGMVAELGSPIELYEKKDGIFRGMCDRSSIGRGDFA